MNGADFSRLPARLLIGLSGGADSVALLLLAHDCGRAAAAVHVNHGLRGDASDGDEAFVRELCGRLGVPLLTFRANPPQSPGEGWAREARYGFFRRAMEQTGADALALAHHRDDQAETLLLHLMRGAGLTGLCGMAADSTMAGMRIVRPLLGVSRQEIRSMLEARGQTWREDATNTEALYLRNRLRLEVLPLMEQLAPGVSARIASAASLLRADEEALAVQTDAFLAQHGANRYLPITALAAQPTALRRRILRDWWTAHDGRGREEHTLSVAQTEAMAALIDGPASARCNLPGGWHGERGWTHLHLVSPDAPDAMQPHAAEDSSLLSIDDAAGRTGDGCSAQAIPSSMLAELTVRTRQPGDWLRPFGSSGRQSLKEYLIDHHVDAPFRDRVPLLCRGSEVLLAGGVGAGDVPRITEYDEAVLLTWREDFPWRRARKQRGGLK